MNAQTELAYQIYIKYMNRGSVDLHSAYTYGMIPKGELKNGIAYYGYCRNSTVAIWDETIQKFEYSREKFGSYHQELIFHPEDDNNFDVFVPICPVICDTIKLL